MHLHVCDWNHFKKRSLCYEMSVSKAFPKWVQQSENKYSAKKLQGISETDNLIILLLFITFRQGIYNYIPKINHVSRVYNVAAILWLRSMLLVMLFQTKNIFYFHISTFWSMCTASNTLLLLLLLLLLLYSLSPLCSILTIT